MLFTFFNVIPELVLTGAFLKGFWEFHWTSAEVPEKDPEGVNIHRVIILSCPEKDNNGEETLKTADSNTPAHLGFILTQDVTINSCSVDTVYVTGHITELLSQVKKFLWAAGSCLFRQFWPIKLFEVVPQELPHDEIMVHVTAQ